MLPESKKKNRLQNFDYVLCTTVALFPFVNYSDSLLTQQVQLHQTMNGC